MPRKDATMDLWEKSAKLLCPCLRFNHFLKKWVAIGHDPCPTRKCRFKTCHNYGKPFDMPDKLIILEEGKNSKVRDDVTYK